MSWIFETVQQAELNRTGNLAPGRRLATTEALWARERDIKAGQDLTDAFQASSKIHSAIPPEGRLIASTGPWTFGAERFRFLALQMRQLQQRRRLKKLLITSTVPEEGKSFVSANLAITLSRGRKQRVLLIDGDLRRPVLGTNLGVGNAPGLSECLLGQIKLSNAIHHIEDLGLWFLPSGNDSEISVEAMQPSQLAENLDALSSSFDWILIDSPPVLPLADASVWSRAVDGVLFVTRKGRTKKRELKRGLESLDKSRIVGVVVNHSSSAGQDSYYGRYVRKLKDSECEAAKVNN